MDPAKFQFLATQGVLHTQAQLSLFAGQQGIDLTGQHSVPLDLSVPTSSASKRRKLGDGQQVAAEGAGSDDEGEMNSRNSVAAGHKLTLEAKRSQHCEVEKKRRERMNRYMTELAQMIPACSAVPRKLDKLSILKMAVDHMKNLRGDPHTNSDYKPGFLTDDELKKLIVEAANGFMLIVECSQAKILFVSDTITDVLQEKPERWVGSCLYDMLHQKDIVKVREQLACFDIDGTLNSSASSVRASPLVMHSQSINGLRRSFLCRVKRTTSDDGTTIDSKPSNTENYKNSENFIKLLHPSHEGSHYAVLHCTGFIRNLTGAERQSLKVDESSTGTCLVAVARLQHFGEGGPKPSLESSENEFVTRVAMDGRFTYVDPRVAGVLGYLPQDLIGQISYEYYHPDDIQKMVHLHHDAMKRRTPMPTVKYRFLSKNHEWLALAMKAFAFVNPFSQQVEYVVCTNVVMRSDSTKEAGSSKDTSMGAGDVSSNKALVPANGEMGTVLPGGDKHVDIKRYLQSQLEQQVAPEDPIEMLLFPDSGVPNQQLLSVSSSSGTAVGSMANTTQSSSGSLQNEPIMPSLPLIENTGTVISTPAAITIEENAATAQHILDEYNRLYVVPPARKDLSFQFPAGLFNNEVNLVGSEEPYRHLLQELDNPSNFPDLFNQVPANPLRTQNAFQDLDLDIFD